MQRQYPTVDIIGFLLFNFPPEKNLKNILCYITSMQLSLFKTQSLKHGGTVRLGMAKCRRPHNTLEASGLLKYQRPFPNNPLPSYYKVIKNSGQRD